VGESRPAPLVCGSRERTSGLYDVIVFDCPPRLSLVSFAALCASDFVIVPLEAADWGAQGIMQVTSAVEYVQSRFNRRLQLLGYLVSRFKRRRAYRRPALACISHQVLCGRSGICHNT